VDNTARENPASRHGELTAETSAAEASAEAVYRSTDPDDPFCGQTELAINQLIAAVESRNPSLQVASAAWRAAAERYPQAVSLEDPMFGFMLSTGGVGMDRQMSETVPGAMVGTESGYMLEVSQKVPWPGKRQLRGAKAVAEAESEQGEIGETRLRLAEASRRSFYEYCQADRLLEVNARTGELMREFREVAKSRYESGQATQQDVLQAELERAVGCPLHPVATTTDSRLATPDVTDERDTERSLRPLSTS
jgi:outer membrane protein TolC